MRLKSIELNGFKTFATKSAFEFADEVTVIVGPNGSGKSNIADAVRWVLGEQSYKMLRGKKTADMIFSGSEERAQAGMATATIVFDNTDGWLPIDFSEVSITRRAYRDGKNEYLINGQQVLLRDINELLAQSGLAERTYTIIGQGLVDAALALKAEERRNLFEEAAGIGLYRSRREDAEKRLEKTRRNLERVEDILAELKPRLRSLERQASRSEKHAQVKEDLQVLMREWYGYHWYRIQERVKGTAQREKESHRRLISARERQAALDQQLSEDQSQVQGLRARLNSWHRELAQQHAQREEITRDLAVSRERMRSLKKQLQELELDQERLMEQKAVFQERVEQTREEVDRLRDQEAEARSQVDALKEAIAGREEERSRLESDLERNREEINLLEKKISRNQAKQEEQAAQVERKRVRVSGAEQAVAGAETALEKREGAVAQAKSNLERVREARQKADQKLENQRKEIKEGEAYRKQQADKVSRLETRISRLEAELEVLQQAEKKLAGYANGARLLLERSRKGDLPGTLGALSTHLEVEERLERPIAAALGEYLDAVIVEKESTSRQALELLLKKTTKGAILPLESMVPPEPVQPRENLPGLIGIAADLVEAPAQLRPAVDLLLGHVFLVENREDVPRVLRGQPLDARAVTLQGEVYFSSGQKLAGNEGQPSTLSRSRQRRTGEEKLAQTRERAERVHHQLKEVDQKIDQLREQEERSLQQLEQARAREEEIQQVHRQAVLDLDQARQQIDWEKSQRQNLVDEIEAGQQEISRLAEEEEGFRRELAEREEQVSQLTRSLHQISLAEERQQMAHWETQLAVNKRALSDAGERLGDREEALLEVKKELDQTRQDIRDARQGIDRLGRQGEEYSTAEVDIEEKISQLEELISKTRPPWKRQRVLKRICGRRKLSPGRP